MLASTCTRSTFRSSENISKTLTQEIGYSTTRYGESFQPFATWDLTLTIQIWCISIKLWTKMSPTKQLNALAAIREDQAKEQLGKFGCAKLRNNSYQNGTTTATTFPFRVTYSNLIQLKTISNFFQATEECVPAPSCSTWPHSLRLEDKALVWNQVFSMGVMDFSYPKQTSRLSRINKKHITFATCKTYAEGLQCPLEEYDEVPEWHVWTNNTKFVKTLRKRKHLSIPKKLILWSNLVAGYVWMFHRSPAWQTRKAKAQVHQRQRQAMTAADLQRFNETEIATRESTNTVDIRMSKIEHLQYEYCFGSLSLLEFTLISK